MTRTIVAVVMATGLCLLLAGGGLQAQAQELVPCCEGGSQANKRCNADANCQGACVGGARDGRPCKDDGKCFAGCVGGDNDGNRCSSDAECPLGTCGAPGTCEQGTCTGLCQKGKRPKSPSDPALAVDWLPDPVTGRPCP